MELQKKLTDSFMFDNCFDSDISETSWALLKLRAGWELQMLGFLLTAYKLGRKM